MTLEAVCVSHDAQSSFCCRGLKALNATVCVACVYACRRLSEPYATGVRGRKLPVYEALHLLMYEAVSECLCLAEIKRRPVQP